VAIAPNVVIKGDPSLLQIAFYNLLENAWKFSVKSPVARIEFGTSTIYRTEVYYVKDNGTGFDMKYADKLFKPFQRLHVDLEVPGTGIGLATVQRIVKRHGGDIWAESEPGKGTTIFFTLTPFGEK
jgi:light-regulated signal transduction histidine kinase (bacteriophytochrome)